jgi:hypothetical protein
MLTKKQIAKLKSDALAEVNVIRKLVSLRPLKNMPKETKEGDSLELCFPERDRDVGCCYIEFKTGDEEHELVHIPTPPAIKDWDAYFYNAERE